MLNLISLRNAVKSQWDTILHWQECEEIRT